MHKTLSAGRACLLATLVTGIAACGGGKSDTNAPAASNTPPTAQNEAPLITAPGVANGAAVTKALDAAGGDVEAAGVRVSVPMDAFTAATVTLQPITDTINGRGQGIAISSDVPWATYLMVTLPFDPAEPQPMDMALAVQQADGSWRVLDQPMVDPVHHTVSAALPFDTEAAAASGAGRVQAQAVPATGPLNVKRVVAFGKFFMTPERVKLDVKGNQTFTPYATVIEAADPSCQVITRPRAPNCLLTVTKSYPFTNDKPGYKRTWQVNAAGHGNAYLGTLTPLPGAGANYVAPDFPPFDPVTINFVSTPDPDPHDPDRTAVAEGGVVVAIDVIPSYRGKFSVDGYDGAKPPPDATDKFQASANLNFQFDGEGASPATPGQSTSSLLHYTASGEAAVTTTYSGCEPATANVPVIGTLQMLIADVPETQDKRNTYRLAVEVVATVMKTVGCGSPPKPTPVQVTFVFSTTCSSQSSTDAFSEGFVDIGSLAGGKSIQCDALNAGWSGEWALNKP